MKFMSWKSSLRFPEEESLQFQVPVIRLTRPPKLAGTKGLSGQIRDIRQNKIRHCSANFKLRTNMSLNRSSTPPSGSDPANPSSSSSSVNTFLDCFWVGNKKFLGCASWVGIPGCASRGRGGQFFLNTHT